MSEIIKEPKVKVVKEPKVKVVKEPKAPKEPKVKVVKEPKVAPKAVPTMNPVTEEEIAVSNRLVASFMTVVRRAELHSMLEGEDYFITTVENGIAYFSDTNYSKLLEKTMGGLRTYLEAQNIEEEIILQEMDNYASSLVIHYIDFKSFSPELVAEARNKYIKAENGQLTTTGVVDHGHDHDHDHPHTH